MQYLGISVNVCMPSVYINFIAVESSKISLVIILILWNSMLSIKFSLYIVYFIVHCILYIVYFNYILYISESDGPSNGVCKSIASNTNGISSHLTGGGERIGYHAQAQSLPPQAEILKARANQAFAAEKYITALHLYNQAAQICPNSAVLYSNRAAALMKRKW